MKELSTADIYKSARAIADDCISQEVRDNAPGAAIPNPANLARRANRGRQRMLPQNPVDLQFDIADLNLPTDFFRADLLVAPDSRHLLFFTDSQMELLKQAQMVTLDATFKIVPRPFSQLLGLHVYIKNGKLTMFFILF